jgi:site-specific recombinase XerD
MEQAIERFERYIKSRYPKSTTAKHYVHDLRQFDQLIGKPPRGVTREDVDQFVEEQLERGLAATTVNRRLAALHEFFEYLAEENQEEEWPNPVNRKRHRVKPGQRLPRDVSEPEIERLFGQIRHARDRAMFRLMLDVGLRVEEVARLEIGDVTMENGSSLGRLRVRGKGDKERFVWLMPETWKIVQAWLMERPKVKDKAMFITRREKGFSVRGIQERLTHYCRLAKVKVSPHQLRHTFGRRMAEAEMPVTSLAALMGHAQVTTTQIYTAGAGVTVQADYQAAMEHLDAVRREAFPAGSVEPGGAAVGGKELDVWRLAGVEPTDYAASQSVVEVEMDLSRYWEGLPDWLTERMQVYIASRQRRWKPSQVYPRTCEQLKILRRIWRWLLEEESISGIADLERAHVQHFVETRLAGEISPVTVNNELTALWAFLHYWEEQGDPVRPSIFRVKRPRRGDALPRFLGESEYQQLERTVLQATQRGERDDWLNRTWFYLLSDAGLRLSEVCDLRLGDVDLAAQRLVVRQGKNNRDRTIPLSSTLQTALISYLSVRGEASTDHLLIHRHQAVKESLIRYRLRRYGQQAQVQVSPHRLRHTLATRLLNEGMPITSLQRLLGHEKLETTLVYARVHDETLRRDYERAQARLTPASLLADELFNAPTQVAEPKPTTKEGNCV